MLARCAPILVSQVVTSIPYSSATLTDIGGRGLPEEMGIYPALNLRSARDALKCTTDPGIRQAVILPMRTPLGYEQRISTVNTAATLLDIFPEVLKCNIIKVYGPIGTGLLSIH